MQVLDWLTRTASNIENCELTHQGDVNGQGGGYAIDILVRMTLFEGATVSILVECKHQARPVERDEILILEGKLRDVGAHKGMLFSTAGFQEGAIKLAAARGIATLTVIDGQWLYETRSTASVSVAPPWVRQSRFAGQRITPTGSGFCRHTINDDQVDAIREFLEPSK